VQSAIRFKKIKDWKENGITITKHLLLLGERKETSEGIGDQGENMEKREKKALPTGRPLSSAAGRHNIETF